MNHVRATFDEGKSWCGESLASAIFYFKDAEHVALNGLMNGETVPCVECVKKITESLNKEVK